MSKNNNKLSDEEILRIVEEFRALSGTERGKRLLGDGAHKAVFDVPGSDVVIKTITPRKKDYIENEKNDMIADYLNSKRLKHKIPDNVESPILVKNPDDSYYQIQKKVDVVKPDSFIKNNGKRKLEGALVTTDAIKQVRMAAHKAGISVPDMSNFNLGYDENHIAKVIDIGEESPVIKNNELVSKNLAKGVETATDKIRKTVLDKPRIYRSLLPAIAKGGLSIGGGLVSLASEAADSEDIGETIEQEALLRSRDNDTVQDGIMKTEGVPDDVKMEALKLFKKNRLPY
jgi:hypothetical protein